MTAREMHFGIQVRKRSTEQDQAGLSATLLTLRALIVILYPCSRVASEKAELFAPLIEHEKGITLLESLYNNSKELLNQHKTGIRPEGTRRVRVLLLPVRRRSGSDGGAESYAT